MHSTEQGKATIQYFPEELISVLKYYFHLLQTSMPALNYFHVDVFANKPYSGNGLAVFLHTENCMLLDKHRRIRGIYNGTLPLEMERMIEDIEILKKEMD